MQPDTPKTPDWSLIIIQLQRAGVLNREICEAMGVSQLTDRMVAKFPQRMISHYHNGQQPLHWRGEGIIGLWCARLGKERAELPMTDLIRGHRVQKRQFSEAPVAKPTAVQALVDAMRPGKRRKKAEAV